MTDAQFDLLLAELRGIRADFRRHILADGRGSGLSRIDRERIARLLPLIFDVLGDSTWEVAHIAARAALPGQDELAEALEPLISGRGGLRSLGKLLARAADSDIDGYRLEQVGDGRNGLLWLVRGFPRV